MERLLNAPVGVPKDFNRQNENAFRQYAEGEFSMAYRKDGDVILPFGFALGFTGANGEAVRFVLNGSGAFTLTVNGVEILNLTSSSATFALNNDGRVTGIRLSDGTTGTIDMLASALNFYDGVTDRALLSAGGGLVTINGDVAVGGSIFLGAARWPLAAQTKTIYAADGDAIEWAGGSALSAIPAYTITAPSGVALAAGEAFDPPTIQSATTTGGTLRLKISTPGATATVTDTTDAAGSGGDPDRVMHKADSADAYNGIYYFRVQGTMTIVSVLSGSDYIHIGSVVLSTWFNDGGGWDEGPSIYLDTWDAGIPSSSGSDETGSHAFDNIIAVAWANAVGQHAGYEWGVSYESGGSLTDFVSVEYTKQAASGSRTGSPNGEQATILVLPKNI